jgi:hypothetical protein
MRFGLATRERQLRPSARLYGDIARANALDPAVLAPHAALLGSLSATS